MGAIVAGVRELGELTRFAARAVLSLRGVWLYLGEALRQAAILIAGSAVVVVGMTFVIGAECGLFTSYFTKAFGATGAVGIFTVLCDVREAFPLMFGYILAAKVACGLVAEIGSMRIAEEIDAMEVMGTDSMRFVVATRLLAALVALPVIYVIAMLAGTLGSGLVVVLQVGEVSKGAWLGGHFGPAHDVLDDVLSLVKGMAVGISVVLTGLFYGYTARGGPVEVGEATARSMVVNLVLIHVIGGTLTILFWGADARLPIGG
ncbi:ABC transporter permease [Conexibacter sp. SYSU D00693]|uniref:MlaE family ABC transporter permease n=1 Tax=Conexibacter sp. SYSU D00693 TaxID=2812560 RepID=UPI00196A3F35|nr:ABC transporter permease [Conexibacter sp. SYSU D00693]